METAGAEAREIFADFAEEWGVLRSTKAADVFDGASIPDVFAQLADMKQLDVGIKRDAMVELLLKGWANEPGDTLADVVNAVTSVHGNAAIDQYQREQFERSAGMLVPVLSRMAASAA